MEVQAHLSDVLALSLERDPHFSGMRASVKGAIMPLKHASEFALTLANIISLGGSVRQLNTKAVVCLVVWIQHDGMPDSHIRVRAGLRGLSGSERVEREGNMGRQDIQSEGTQTGTKPAPW